MQQGTTIGQVEQLLGSNTISGAIFTQIKLRALNLTAIGIILLWVLSPLGSQAVLRVVYTDRVSLASTIPMKVIGSFTPYQFLNGDGFAQASVTLIPSLTALILAGQLLSSRNQDLWSNIRVPRIDSLANHDDYSWKSLVNRTDIVYASLVGLPVAPLLSVRNQTFTITNTSYTDLQCSTPIVQKYVNFTSDAPSPGGKTDCKWASVERIQFSLAFSQACSDQPAAKGEVMGARDARQLVWQSSVLQGNQVIYANCKLSTVYVDLKMTCQMGVCVPISIRRTQQITNNGNWTTMDFIPNFYFGDFTKIWESIFPNAGIAGTVSPIPGYISDPKNPLKSSGNLQGLSKNTFELRRMQILNSVLMLGFEQAYVVGLNTTEAAQRNFSLASINGTLTTTAQVIRCNRAWLALLAISSIVVGLLALGSAGLRLIIRIPDVLCSVSLAMLDNKALRGSTTWDADQRARDGRPNDSTWRCCSR